MLESGEQAIERLARESYDAALSKYQAMDRRVQRLTLALKLMVEGPRIERIKTARAQLAESEAELAKVIVDTFLAAEFDPNGASADNVRAIDHLDERMHRSR